MGIISAGVEYNTKNCVQKLYFQKKAIMQAAEFLLYLNNGQFLKLILIKIKTTY